MVSKSARVRATIKRVLCALWGHPPAVVASEAGASDFECARCGVVVVDCLYNGMSIGGLVIFGTQCEGCPKCMENQKAMTWRERIGTRKAKALPTSDFADVEPRTYIRPLLDSYVDELFPDLTRSKEESDG